MDGLPDEILLNIRRYLPSESSTQLRAASKQLRRVADDRSLIYDTIRVAPGKAIPPQVRFRRAFQEVERVADVSAGVTDLTYIAREKRPDLSHLADVRRLVFRGAAQVVGMPANIEYLEIDQWMLPILLEQGEFLPDNFNEQRLAGLVRKILDNGLLSIPDSVRVLRINVVEDLLDLHDFMIESRHPRAIRVDMLRTIEFSSPRDNLSYTKICPPRRLGGFYSNIRHNVMTGIPVSSVSRNTRVLTMSFGGPILEEYMYRSRIQEIARWHLDYPQLRVLGIGGETERVEKFIIGMFDQRSPIRNNLQTLRALAFEGDIALALPQISTESIISTIFASSDAQGLASSADPKLTIFITENPINALLDFLAKTEKGRDIAGDGYIAPRDYGYTFA